MKRPRFGFFIVFPSALLAVLWSPDFGYGQTARVPAATVQQVISAEYAYCSRTENATAAQLETIGSEIEQAMTQAQRAVDRLAADSTAVARAVKTAQDKYDEIDGRLSPLQIERAKVLADMKPHADNIARAEQGNAPAGAQTEHAQLMEQEAGLRARIASLTAEIEKLRGVQRDRSGRIITRGDDVQDFIQSMTADEGPVGYLRQAQKDLERVMARLREIRRETIPIRFSPEYTALQRRLEELNNQIGEIEPQLDEAKRARDNAKTARDNFDSRALETAREVNLYTYEHMTRAQHCVQKRRQQLNAATPAVTATTTGTFTGQYGVYCRFTDPDYGEMTDGGTVSLTFNGRGGVSGTYTGGNGTYGVGGSVAADGGVGGTGSGSGWTVNWGGRVGQQGGAAVGNGNVTVNITQYGGGTCTGTWSIP